MKTFEELEERANTAILNAESVAYDTAAKHGVNFHQVKHMGWFHSEVMLNITKQIKDYSHLSSEVYA
jgi:hypothetical protein